MEGISGGKPGAHPVFLTSPSPEQEYAVLLACMELLAEAGLSEETRRHVAAVAEMRAAALREVLRDEFAPDPSWKWLGVELTAFAEDLR